MANRFEAKRGKEEVAINTDDSCIIRHIKHYHRISAHDTALLLSLERDPAPAEAGQMLWNEDDPASHFYTVKSGWGYSFRDMPDGRRQALELFLPGDIIGLREFAFRSRLTSVAMVTDGTVCAFPIQRLVDVFRSSPTLTTVFFAIAAREDALLTERLVTLGRRTARQKVAHLVAEIQYRLRRTVPDLGNGFRLPLTQQILADMLGLSAVHVSRTFTELSEAGVLERRRERVVIHSVQRLIEEADFASKYLSDDVSSLVTEPQTGTG